MKDIREMTIDEIDNYGSEIQENIKDVSSTILDKTNMISMGGNQRVYRRGNAFGKGT